MKKIATLILSLALALSLSVPVFAETYSDGEAAKTEVYFNYAPVKPKYVVEIPAKIELKLGQDVYLPVTVSSLDSLNGEKVAISLEDALAGDVSWYGNNQFHDQLIVKNPNAPDGYYSTLGYKIWGYVPGYDIWAYFHNLPAPVDELRLLNFSEDGTQNIILHLYTVSPYDGSPGYTLNPALIYPNSEYYGKVIFGIRLI